jgi:rhodanese-related sulfurtransferase
MANNEDKYHISAEEFALKYKNREFDEEKVQIIDVREPEEWAVYRLKRSKLIPMNTIPERLGELHPGKKIYLICAHGVRSLHVANFLLHHSFQDVVNVDGGLAEVSLYLDEEDLS